MIHEKTTLETLYRVHLGETTSGWMTVWARMLPRVLLAARPGLGRVTHERTYTAAELACVAGDEDHKRWSVVTECTDDLENWRWLCDWALRNFYPAYRHRYGREHACQVRVEWLQLQDRIVSAPYNHVA